MRLAILIPVYNEERLLATVIERLLATGPLLDASGTVIERRVYLVDDGSSDGTAKVCDQLRLTPGIHVIRHERNSGKGAAIRTALTAARADDGGADVYLIHDADLEYDPRDHAKLLQPIIAGHADAVIGSRFLGETHRVLYFWHSVANKAITTLCNVFTNLNLTDIECCSKAFTRAVADQLTIAEDRFGIEPELIARIARVKLPSSPRIYEVAVSYAGRTYAEGKKITWRDGFSAVRCILKYNLLY